MNMHPIILVLSALAAVGKGHQFARILRNPCSSQSLDQSTVNDTTRTIGLTFRFHLEDSPGTRTILANMYILMNEGLYHLNNLRNRCPAEFKSRRMCGELRLAGFFTNTPQTGAPREDLQVDYIQTAKILKFLLKFHTRRQFSGSESILLLRNKCREVLCHLKMLIEDLGAELPSLDDVIYRRVTIGNIEDFLTGKQQLYNHYMENFAIRNSQC